MPTNVIVNGSFDQNPGDPNFGWSGNDLETTYSENTYQGNGSNDSVAEMNGSANQTTVMEQTFTVGNPLTTQLTLEAAIRNSGRSEVDVDGFQVEITDSAGTVIFSTTVFPQSITFEAFSFDVTFPAAGDYTITFTEEGEFGDSYGALVDDIELMVCLTAGSLIDTPIGPIPIEELTVGMLLMTTEGAKPLRWIGCKKLSVQDLAENEKLRPVLIRADSLGAGKPSRDMRVSRQHRMLVSSPITKRMFGTRDVFVPAIRLTVLPGIDLCSELRSVTYFHLLLDEHAIITADDALTESLYAGPIALHALSDAARTEILTLFSHLHDESGLQSAAFIPERKKQIRLIDRHRKNGRAIQGGF